MIIDEKGKLFGKINIIDLVILLVVVVAVAVLGIKFASPKMASSTTKTHVAMYYAEEVPEYVADDVKVGDKLMDEARNVELGTVTDVKIDESVYYSNNSSGVVVKSSKEGYKSVLITSEVEATPFEHGMIVNSSRYYIGHTFTLLSGKAKLYLKVYDINLK